jgi:mycothiol synthase
MRQLFMRRPDLDDLPAPSVLPAGHELRTARPDDADGIAAVLASAFESDWTADKVRRELLEAPDVETTYLVTAGGFPVATASARLLPERYPGSGYVHWVGTHGASRGQGLGRAVTLATLYRFRELGCRDAVLETDPPRLPAIRLYLALGFRPESAEPAQDDVWREVLAAITGQG